MKRNTFFKNAAILTVTSLLLRSAGMVFRIYTSGVIGAEGMGLYQLILSVYTLGSTFATCGISTAVTRLVTDALALDRPGAVRRIMVRSMLLSAGIGLVSALILFFGADIIGNVFLKDPRTVPALKILCAGLPFMGITACLRGYFLARRRVQDTSGAQLFEQCVRMVLIWRMLSRINGQNAAKACGAVMLGDTAAECCACLLLWLRYRRDRRQIAGGRNERPSPVLKPLLHIAVPITAGRYLNTVLRTVENIMVPDRLTAYSGSREQALASFGALKGMAMPLLFFPSSFLGAFSTLLIPEISEAATLGQRERVKRAVRRTLQLTILSSLLISGVFTLYADTLGQLIYQSDEVGLYLRVLGPLMPIMYTESVVDGILKGLGQQVSSLKYSVLDSATRIVMIVLLVPRFGMAGFLFVMLVSNLLTCYLNIRRLLTVSEVRFEWGKWVVIPLAAIGAAATAAVFLQRQLVAEGLWALLLGGAVTAVLYVGLLKLFGCLRREALPLRRKKEADEPAATPPDETALAPHDAVRQGSPLLPLS